MWSKKKKKKNTALLYSRAVISLNQHTMQVFKTCGTICTARIVFVIFGRPIIETVISATIIERAKVVNLARCGREKSIEIIVVTTENNISAANTFQVFRNPTFLGSEKSIELWGHFVGRVRHCGII
jgi:hypothetical protein